MIRPLLIALSLAASPLLGAQPLNYADVKAKTGTQLSADELRQLMPGAKVVSRTPQGSTRYWHNKPDGTFVASSDGRGVNGRNNMASGEGTWQVRDNGTLCVKIQWTRISEDWCRYIFKVGDKYYGVGRHEDTAPANEFEFSK